MPDANRLTDEMHGGGIERASNLEVAVGVNGARTRLEERERLTRERL
jgi:hypothetical protein